MADQKYLDTAASTRLRWNSRYAEGELPWDTQITPPEVHAFWQSGRLPPRGIALDLGCGPGTNVRFLAELGLTAVGVEIADPPLVVGQGRLTLRFAAPRAQAEFVCADVCALPFHALNATYILDIGCLHSLPPESRAWYAQGVVTNLASGGYYHLYAFDDSPGDDASERRGARGMLPGEVSQLFTPILEVVEEVIARPDRRPCRWYLLRKF